MHDPHRHVSPNRPVSMTGITDDQFDPAIDRLVDTVEAARILDVKPGTLAKARVYGGPYACRFVKLGRSVRYSTRTLAEHVRRNTASSTSEHWAAN